jgi:hypothetical protein
MGRSCRVVAVAACFFASLCASAQVGDAARKVVLPNPQLIHCRSLECSQLWKQESGEGHMLYPAQVLTDLVDGEVVGLTAIYDKSVSTQEIRYAIQALYSKWDYLHDGSLWRVEPEKLVLQLAERTDGTKILIYLKLGPGSLVPAAHINSPPNDCDQ